MKKSIVFLACLVAFVSVSFAQEYVDSKAEMEHVEKVEQDRTKIQEIIIPDGFNGYSDKKYMAEEIVSTGGIMKLEYSPLYDEVRIYYICMMVQYDRGDAMNAILGALQDFAVMTEYTNSNGDTYAKDKYYRYKYLAADKEKYFKNDRGFGMVQYISHVKFEK